MNTAYALEFEEVIAGDEVHDLLLDLLSESQDNSAAEHSAG